jgi:hypothetical protein
MEPCRSILEDLERATIPEDETREFLPQLRWGHYQELMRVENRNERHFYQIEAAKEGWDLPHAPTGGPQFCFQRLIDRFVLRIDPDLSGGGTGSDDDSFC